MIEHIAGLWSCLDLYILVVALLALSLIFSLLMFFKILTVLVLHQEM